MQLKLLAELFFLLVGIAAKRQRDNELVSKDEIQMPKIICINGVETNGACFCNQNFVGKHCERKIQCLSFERQNDGKCFACKQNYVGEHCDRMVCKNGKEDEYEQKCVCDKPFTGQFCDLLTTKDIYFYYNSQVAKMGPLGALILIPMILVYYVCEHFAKQRQVRRIEKTYMDQVNILVDSDRIKSLLDEKE